MALQKFFPAGSIVAIALSPFFVLASCATASVGDGEDSRAVADAGARATVDSSYGGAPNSDDASVVRDAEVAVADASVKTPITRDGLVSEWLFTGDLNDTSGNSVRRHANRRDLRCRSFWNRQCCCSLQWRRPIHLDAE